MNGLIRSKRLHQQVVFTPAIIKYFIGIIRSQIIAQFNGYISKTLDSYFRTSEGGIFCINFFEG